MAKSKEPQIYSLPTDREVEYPVSDGKPMAETTVHWNLMTDFVHLLDDYFQDRPDVFVGGNLIFYYEKGNPRKFIAPDVFVVFGVEKKERDYYQLWEEGKGPDFVLEVSSKNTYRMDLNKKKRLYAQVFGVSDYFLYDPNHLYLNPPLQGYRLVGGTYIRISPVEGRLSSDVLGLELGFQPDGKLGLYHPQTHTWLLRRKERAEQAEAELARLRAELQRFKGQSPQP
ncbi:Uma2 family endonuclease [Candidatus Poribacteria bacterium]|nr:Uma2 family endonuclease [Candidatus Poribacteria bacterium]